MPKAAKKAEIRNRLIKKYKEREPTGSDRTCSACFNFVSVTPGYEWQDGDMCNECLADFARQVLSTPQVLSPVLESFDQKRSQLLKELIAAAKVVNKAALGMADHSPGWAARPSVRGVVTPKQRRKCKGKCGLHDATSRLEKAIKQAEKALMPSIPSILEKLKEKLGEEVDVTKVPRERELLLGVIEKLIDQRDLAIDLHWKKKNGRDYTKRTWNGYFFDLVEGWEI